MDQDPLGLGATLKRRPPKRKVRRGKLKACVISFPRHLDGKVGWFDKVTGYVMIGPRETPPTYTTGFELVRHWTGLEYKILTAKEAVERGVSDIEYETDFDAAAEIAKYEQQIH